MSQLQRNFLGSVLISLILVGCFGKEHHTGEAKSTFRHSKQPILDSHISKDGRFSILAEKDKVCVWDNQTNELRFDCLTGSLIASVEQVGIAGDNRFFYASNLLSISFFSMSDAQPIGTWTTGINIIRDIAVSDNGEIVLLGYRSGQAAVIETKNFTATVYPIHRLDINSVAISADGKTAFTGSSDKTAKLWDPLSGKVIKEFKLDTRVNYVNINSDASLGFAIDSVSDRLFLDLKNGEILAEMDGLMRFMEINDSQFINNDKWLLTGSPKQLLRLWNVADGNQLAEWVTYRDKTRQRTSVLSVKKSGKDRVMSHTSDGVLETWDLPPAQITQ